MKRVVDFRAMLPTLRIAAGVALLILGLLGLVLPVLQGFLFLAAGVALLAPHVPLFRRLRDRIRRRAFARFRHTANRPE